MTGAERDEDGCTYELTIAGTVGPVMRCVLPASSVVTVETSTFRVEESAERDLAQVVALIEAAGVRVRAVHRLRSS